MLGISRRAADGIRGQRPCALPGDVVIGTTILRRLNGREWESVVGLDVSEVDAEQLVSVGAAEYRTYELPPALYLSMPLSVRGFTYPAGALLHVGGEISEAEATLLMFEFTKLPGGQLAAPPGGGIG